MTPNDVRGEIVRLGVELLRHNLAIDTNSPVLRMRQGQTALVWATAPGPPRAAAPPIFGTVAHYRYLLEHRQYNMMLLDGAILQFFFVYRHLEVLKSSLTYCPCPVSLVGLDTELPLGIGDLVDENLVVALEDLEWLAFEGRSDSPETSDDGEALTERSSRLLMRGPFRFDLDVSAQAPNHPASHLHLGDPECRIPLSASVSVGHFARFVFRHFYPAIWRSSEFLRSWPIRHSTRSITEAEEEELFLDCRAPTGLGT